MALPIAGVPYYKFRVEIITLVFLLLFLEIKPDEFPVIGNYGESLLEELRDKPIEINSCGLEDLLRLPGVEEELAQAIMKEREKRGGFKNLSDLLTIKGMNFELWERIAPFLVIREKGVKTPRDLLRDFKFRSGFFPEGIYQFTRFNLQEKDLSFLFLTEKDRGDLLFDFTSFHLTGQEGRFYWVLGDFFPIGPELIFSPPYFHFYRNFAFGSFCRRNLEPLRFVSETHYLRGLGITFSGKKGSETSLFLNSKSLDAMVDTSGVVQKIYYTGEHRDSLSRTCKGRLKEKGVGWQMRWQSGEASFLSFFSFNDYRDNFSFGRKLLLLGFSIRGKVLEQKWGWEWAKSLPGDWGMVSWMSQNWRSTSYWIRLSYQKGNFFNLYGYHPNYQPGNDELLFDTKLRFSFPFFTFSFSYNTKTNFTYDSLPHQLSFEWQGREKRLEWKISEKIYLGEEKSGSGVEITYRFSPNLFLRSGIMAKYQRDKRGFKFSAQIKISDLTISGYKAFLKEGIDFYHLETEGYEDNNYLTEKVAKVIIGYGREIGFRKFNFGLGIAKREKYSYDFKIEVK